MNRLVISGYGSDFNHYDHLYAILDRLRFARAGVEFCIFSDKPDYLRGMMAQRDRFREFYTTLHGPHVEVEPSSRHNIGLSAVVFLLPCICLGAGYILGQSLLHLGDGMALLAAAAGQAVGCIPAALINRAILRSGRPEFAILKFLR